MADRRLAPLDPPRKPGARTASPDAEALPLERRKRARLERRPWLSRSTAAGSTISVATSAAPGRFWIFLVLFVASLFAEFIANDRPILVVYKGEILFPCSTTIPRRNSAAF